MKETLPYFLGMMAGGLVSLPCIARVVISLDYDKATEQVRSGAIRVIYAVPDKLVDLNHEISALDFSRSDPEALSNILIDRFSRFYYDFLERTQ